jgi:hypothetical protein
MPYVVQMQYYVQGDKYTHLVHSKSTNKLLVYPDHKSAKVWPDEALFPKVDCDRAPEFSLVDVRSLPKLLQKAIAEGA